MFLNCRSTGLSQVSDVIKVVYLYTVLLVDDLVMTSFLRKSPCKVCFSLLVFVICLLKSSGLLLFWRDK